MSQESNIEEGEISEPRNNTYPSAKPSAQQHYDRGYHDRSYTYHAAPVPPPRYSSYPPSRPRDGPRDAYLKYSGPPLKPHAEPVISTFYPPEYNRPPPPPPPPTAPRPSSRQSDHHEADMDIDSPPLPVRPPAPMVPPPPPPPVVAPPAAQSQAPPPVITPTIEAPPPLITIVTDPSQQVQEFYAAPLPPPHSKPAPMPSANAAQPRPLLLPKPIALPSSAPALTSSLSTSTASTASPSTPYSVTPTATTPSDAEDRRRRLKWGQGLKRQVSANKVEDVLPATAPVSEECKDQGGKDEVVEATAPDSLPSAETKKHAIPEVVQPSEQFSEHQALTPCEADEESGSSSEDGEAEADFNEHEEEKADDGGDEEEEEDDLVDSDDDEEREPHKNSDNERATGNSRDDNENDVQTHQENETVERAEDDNEEQSVKNDSATESPLNDRRRSVGRPALTERVKQQRKQERKERKMGLVDEEAAPRQRGRTPTADEKRRRSKQEGDEAGEPTRRKRGRPSAATIAAGQGGKKAARSSAAATTCNTGSGVRQRERHPLAKIFTTMPDLKRAVTALQYMIHIQTQLKGSDKQSKFLEYIRNPNLIVNLPLPLVSEISGCLDYIESRGHKCYETLHLLHMEQYKRQVRAVQEPSSTSLVTAISQANRHKIYESHIFTKAMPPVLIHDTNTSASHNIYDSNKLKEQLEAKRPIMAQIIRNKVMHKKAAWVNSANMYLSKYDRWKHHESSTSYNDSSFDKYDYDCLRSSRFRNDEAQIMHKLAIGAMMEKRLKSGGSDVVSMVTPWVFPDRNMNLANTNTEKYSVPEFYYPAHVAEPCAIIPVHSNRLTTDGKRQQCINTTNAIESCLNCNCAWAVDAEEKRSNVWTDMEKCIFVDKFIQYPKNFSKIASYLKNKTTKDVIGFYYDTKYKMNFKVLLKEVDNRKRGLKNSYTASSNAARICGGVLHATSTKYFYQVPLDDNTYNAPLPSSVDPETEEQDVSKLSNELQLMLRRHVENGGKETPVVHHHHQGMRGRGRGGRRGRRGNRNRGDTPAPIEPNEPVVQSPSMMPRTIIGRPPLGTSRGRRGRGRGRGRGRNSEHEGTARQIAKRRMEMASSSSSSQSESESEEESADAEGGEVAGKSEGRVEVKASQSATDENSALGAEASSIAEASEADEQICDIHNASCDTNENLQSVANDVVRQLVDMCDKLADNQNGGMRTENSQAMVIDDAESFAPVTAKTVFAEKDKYREVNGGSMPDSSEIQDQEVDIERKRKLSEDCGPALKCMRVDVSEEEVRTCSDQDKDVINAEHSI